MVSWVVVLARAARRREKVFFFFSFLIYFHVYIHGMERTFTCILCYSDYSSRVLLCVWTWQGFSLIFPHSPHRQLESKVFWTPVDQHRPTELSHIRFHLYTWKRTCRHLSIWGDSFWNSGISSFDFWKKKFFFSKVRALFCFLNFTAGREGDAYQGLFFFLVCCLNWKKK
jgi:hypothetical protein